MTTWPYIESKFSELVFHVSSCSKTVDPYQAYVNYFSPIWYALKMDHNSYSEQIVKVPLAVVKSVAESCECFKSSFLLECEVLWQVSSVC